MWGDGRWVITSVRVTVTSWPPVQSTGTRDHFRYYNLGMQHTNKLKQFPIILGVRIKNHWNILYNIILNCCQFCCVAMFSVGGLVTCTRAQLEPGLRLELARDIFLCLTVLCRSVDSYLEYLEYLLWTLQYLRPPCGPHQHAQLVAAVQQVPGGARTLLRREGWQDDDI